MKHGQRWRGKEGYRRGTLEIDGEMEKDEGRASEEEMEIDGEVRRVGGM